MRKWLIGFVCTLLCVVNLHAKEVEIKDIMFTNLFKDTYASADGVVTLTHTGEVWNLKDNGSIFFESSHIKKMMTTGDAYYYLNTDGKIYAQFAYEDIQDLLDIYDIEDYTDGTRYCVTEPMALVALEDVRDFTVSKNMILYENKQGQVSCYVHIKNQGNREKDLGTYKVKSFLPSYNRNNSETFAGFITQDNKVYFTDSSAGKVRSIQLKQGQEPQCIFNKYLFVKDKDSFKVYDLWACMSGKNKAYTICKNAGIIEIMPTALKDMTLYGYGLTKDNELLELETLLTSKEKMTSQLVDNGVTELIDYDHVLHSKELFPQAIYKKGNEYYTLRGKKGVLIKEDLQANNTPLKLSLNPYRESDTAITTVGMEGHLMSLAFNGTTYVAVGDDILYSNNGVDWEKSQVLIKYQTGFKKVIWDGKRFIAVGQLEDTTDRYSRKGVISTSTEGKKWSQPIIADAAYLDIDYDGSTYRIVTRDDSVIASTDLVNWTEEYSYGAQKNYIGTYKYVENNTYNIGDCTYNKIARNSQGLLIAGTHMAIKKDGHQWSEIAPKYNITFEQKNAEVMDLRVIKDDFYMLLSVDNTQPSIVFKSKDGVNWDVVVEEVYDNFRKQYIFDNKGGIGVDPRNPVYGVYRTDCIWDGEKYVASAATGKVYTSKDMTEWTMVYPKYKDALEYAKGKGILPKDATSDTTIDFKGQKIRLTHNNIFLESTGQAVLSEEYRDDMSGSYYHTINSYVIKDDVLIIGTEKSLLGRMISEQFSQEGAIIYTTDGIHFNTIDLGKLLPNIGSAVYDVEYWKGQIYVFATQAILTSKDGINYTVVKTLDKGTYITQRAYFKENYYFGGKQLKISTDGIQYKVLSEKVLNIYAFIEDDHCLIAIGEDGVYYTYDGVQWFESPVPSNRIYRQGFIKDDLYIDRMFILDIKKLING